MVRKRGSKWVVYDRDGYVVSRHGRRSLAELFDRDLRLYAGGRRNQDRVMTALGLHTNREHLGRTPRDYRLTRSGRYVKRRRTRAKRRITHRRTR